MLAATDPARLGWWTVWPGHVVSDLTLDGLDQQVPRKPRMEDAKAVIG